MSSILQDKLDAAFSSGTGGISASDVQSPREDDTEAEVEELDQPTLSARNITALQQSRLLLDHQAVTMRMDVRGMEYIVKAAKRDEQLEERLEPLKLEEILFNDSVSQVIPVSENFVLEFRTVPTRTAILFRAAVRKYIEGRSHTMGDYPEAERNFLDALASLSCGLVSMNRVKTTADEIIATKDPKEAVDKIVESMEELSERPVALLDTLSAQHRNFITRVRKVLDHAGYREQEVKKS